MIDERVARHRFNTTRAIVVYTFATTQIVLLLLVGTALYLFIRERPIPSELASAASAAVGYILGNGASIFRDYVTREDAI